MSRSRIRAAAAAGLDWITPPADMHGAADDEQLKYASRLGRAILTANQRDFVALHTRWMNEGGHHSGIIVLTWQAMPVGQLLRKVMILQRERSIDDLRDAILFITRLSPE